MLVGLVRCTVDSSYKIFHHQNTEILSYSCYIVILPYSILQHHYILGLYTIISGIQVLTRSRGLEMVYQSPYFLHREEFKHLIYGFAHGHGFDNNLPMQLFFHDMILARIFIYSLNCGMVSDLKTWIKSEMEIRRANSLLVQLDFWGRLFNLLFSCDTVQLRYLYQQRTANAYYPFLQYNNQFQDHIVTNEMIAKYFTWTHTKVIISNFRRLA